LTTFIIMAILLIVEDDENLLTLIKENLNLSHTILTGHNGREAW